jgi:hypothetical protein
MNAGVVLAPTKASLHLLTACVTDARAGTAAWPRPASYWLTAQNTSREFAAASGEDLDRTRVQDGMHIRERALSDVPMRLVEQRCRSRGRAERVDRLRSSLAMDRRQRPVQGGGAVPVVRPAQVGAFSTGLDIRRASTRSTAPALPLAFRNPAYARAQSRSPRRPVFVPCESTADRRPRLLLPQLAIRFRPPGGVGWRHGWSASAGGGRIPRQLA